MLSDLSTALLYSWYLYHCSWVWSTKSDTLYGRNHRTNWIWIYIIGNKMAKIEMKIGWTWEIYQKRKRVVVPFKLWTLGSSEGQFSSSEFVDLLVRLEFNGGDNVSRVIRKFNFFYQDKKSNIQSVYFHCHCFTMNKLFIHVLCWFRCFIFFQKKSLWRK